MSSWGVRPRFKGRKFTADTRLFARPAESCCEEVETRLLAREQDGTPPVYRAASLARSGNKKFTF